MDDRVEGSCTEALPGTRTASLSDPVVTDPLTMPSCTDGLLLPATEPLADAVPLSSGFVTMDPLTWFSCTDALLDRATEALAAAGATSSWCGSLVDPLMELRCSESLSTGALIDPLSEFSSIELWQIAA